MRGEKMRLLETLKKRIAENKKKRETEGLRYIAQTAKLKKNYTAIGV
jgi:hypothetical protein